MWVAPQCLLVLPLLLLVHGQTKPPGFLQRQNDNSCFCKLGGEIDDCSCTVESVDLFNNNNIYPVLNSLMEKNYFKYYPVDLDVSCKHWPASGHCTLRDCSVKPCPEDEIPIGLKSAQYNKYSEHAQAAISCDESPAEDPLGKIDRTISDDSREAFKSWIKHDYAQPKFCEVDDESSPSLKYVNLLLNPEAYTGYSGVDAHKIWNSIYNENCFIDGLNESESFVNTYASKTPGSCLEKRVFFRMVSGLHSSISTHLSARYFFPKKTAFEKDRWGMNPDLFKSRFDPALTSSRGPQWLRNLYFTYLVELRALSKVAPYLKQQLYFTGNSEEDQETRQVVTSMLDTISAFPQHFDESQLFQGDSANLKDEFRLKFLNISSIMDCVGCEKCKLWGKVQIRGMGTALKILFSGDSMAGDSTITEIPGEIGRFQLTRVEIVSLFNAFARLSNSIKYIEDFRRLVT